MSNLSNVKLVLDDGEKSKNGKGTAAKKIYRKIAKKQTDAAGHLSATAGNAPVVKSKIQQRVLRAPKETVKKSITQSTAKKSSAQKASAVTTERTPINLQMSRPTKKHQMARDPKSVTIDGAQTKRTKPVKRVPKAIPTTATTTTTTTIATPLLPTKATVTSYLLDGTKPKKSAVKRPVKGVVKRVLKKKLESSLNGKIVESKAADSITAENLMPILSIPRIHHRL